MHKATVYDIDGVCHTVRAESLLGLMDLYQRQGMDPYIVTPGTIQIGKRHGQRRAAPYPPTYQTADERRTANRRGPARW